MEFYESIANYYTNLFNNSFCFQDNGLVQHAIPTSINDEIIGMLTMIISFEEIHNIVLVLKKDNA